MGSVDVGWLALTSAPMLSSPGLRVITPPRSSGIASSAWVVLDRVRVAEPVRDSSYRGRVSARGGLRGSLFVSPPDRSHATTCRGPRLECKPF